MAKQIELTQGQIAIVDDNDFEYLNQWKWSAAFIVRRFYATRTEQRQGKKKTISMHREIMNAPSGMQVDHIDGNGLNNTRANLRLCTPKENSRNRAKPKGTKNKYKGVIHGKHGKYSAKIGIYLGTFDTPEEAARAYDEAVKRHFGEFANLNFPESN